VRVSGVRELADRGRGAQVDVAEDEAFRAIQDQRRDEIMTKLAVVFGNEDQYRPFLKQSRSNTQIQTLLDLFTTVGAKKILS
jgi:hypothetical protein